MDPTAFLNQRGSGYATQQLVSQVLRVKLTDI